MYLTTEKEKGRAEDVGEERKEKKMAGSDESDIDDPMEELSAEVFPAFSAPFVFKWGQN